MWSPGSDIKKYNKVQEYSLNKQQIEIIWDTVGGSAWGIYYILQMLFQSSLADIVARMKREKTALVTDWCFRDVKGERRQVLSKFIKTPLQLITAFEPRQLDVLGQAVKDNMLYYDPVEGIYGVQGKSLEWGVKAYSARENRREPDLHS